MKCLVTKLQGAVNDDSLLKLGEIRFKVLVSGDAANKDPYIMVRSVKPQTIKVIGEGELLGYTSGDLTVQSAAVMPMPAFEARRIIPSQAPMTVSLSDKYSLQRFLDGIDGVESIDLSSFAYSQEIYQIDCHRAATGDISVLKNLTKLTQLNVGAGVSGNLADLPQNKWNYINIYDSTIAGDISLLAYATEMVRFDVARTNVTGTLESLLEGQWEAGRTSGKLTTFINGSPASFNGISGTESAFDATFSDSGCTVVHQGVTVGVLANGVWAYT